MKDLRELTESSLSKTLKISADKLRSLSQKAPLLYRERKESKKSGGLRLIEAPHENLKSTQRNLLHGILDHLPLSDSFFGRAGSSAIQAAQLHVNKPMVVTMDIKDFFPSVSSKMVYGMFRRRGASQVVAKILTRLVTRKSHLPQGAPTSSCVAALVLSPAIHDIERAIKSIGVSSFSVYVDDVALSGPVGLKRIKETVVSIFERHGFRVHPAKIRVMPKGMNQEVLGLAVNRGLEVSQSFQAEYEQKVNELGPSHPTVKGKRNYIDSVAKTHKSA
ncbi:MAG: hypothetical protein A2283_19070 [Lentisphaerae bacterium RIFOXYA12_FULL_48_11]|nr:MAG: hypothetical protein A2283_19070 [Lentisphaerae bacterium RIFOXYA12_FULL_48_11]